MELELEYFQKLNTKKETTIRNSDFIKRMAKDSNYKFMSSSLFNRAERMKHCLNFWEWVRFDKSKVLDLKKVSRCKDIFCPNCRAFNNSKYLLKNINDILLCNRDYGPYLMTLTIPSVYGDDLRETIGLMNIAFKKFYNRLSRNDSNGMKNNERLFDAVGCIRCLEVTYNYKTSMFHPHFHCIIFLDRDIEQDFNKYIPAGWHIKSNEYIYKSDSDEFISEVWTREFEGKNFKGDDYSCDIRACLMPDGLFEVFKYVFKDSNFLDYYSFSNLFISLANKRLKQGYGMLYNCSDNESEDELLEGNNLNEFVDSDEDFSFETFNNIMGVVSKYPEYKKISRFNKDNEFYDCD